MYTPIRGKRFRFSDVTLQNMNNQTEKVSGLGSSIFDMFCDEKFTGSI